MPFLVVVSGPSCSGKTTLSRALAPLLGARLLHLDARWVGGDKPLVAGFPSRERPHLYDGAAMYAEARDIRARGEPVLCEGFLSMLYGGAGEAALSLFVRTPHAELVRRRAARAARGGNDVWAGLRGPDGPPPAEAEVDRAWAAHGEREWALWGECQAAMPGVVVLDGMLPPDRLLALALDAARARGLPAPPP